jgi:hypothetical protein
MGGISELVKSLPKTGTIRPMQRFTFFKFMLGALTAVVLAYLIYLVPPVHDRLEWRMDFLMAYIGGIIHPANQIPLPVAVVSLDPHSLTIGTATPTKMASRLPSVTPLTGVKSAVPTLAATATQAPTPTPTPLPAQVKLDPPPYEKQTVNNCGPASLSLYLRTYGWEGNQKDVTDVVKPNIDDRNVNVDELGYYVSTHVGWLKYIFRLGEDEETLKRFLAEGIPVMIEETFKSDKPGWPNDDLWAGHYLLITGYDDNNKVFITQDTYYGANRMVSYQELDQNWESFNRVLIVVYRPEVEPTVQSILGSDWDVDANRKHALEEAQAAAEANPKDAFAWFNAGSNLVYFESYIAAAQAYDTARQIGLPQRMFRYQFGPFLAYFHAGRDADLLALTEYALQRTPNSEEAALWHGWALYRAGKTPDAVDAFKKALEFHPGYSDALYALNFLGQ